MDVLWRLLEAFCSFFLSQTLFSTRENTFCPLVFMIPWFGFAHLFEECDSCDSKKTQLARVRTRVCLREKNFPIIPQFAALYFQLLKHLPSPPTNMLETMAESNDH